MFYWARSRGFFLDWRRITFYSELGRRCGFPRNLRGGRNRWTLAGRRGRWNWYSFYCRPGLWIHGWVWEAGGWGAGLGSWYHLSLWNRRLRGYNNLKIETEKEYRRKRTKC